MKVYIGADHRGYDHALVLEEYLKEQGVETELLGSNDHASEDDYVDFAIQVSRKVASDPVNRGVVLCGSGVGMDIAANKIPGIRAFLGYSADQVKSARNDDDVNVLALGADFTSPDTAKELVHAFLNTPFDNSERRVRRIEKIKQLE